MAFLLWCPNKGCRKQNEAMLDVDTNEVYCGECNGLIPNVPVFTKTQMKTLKQVRKPVKEAFAMECGKCKKKALPKFENNQFLCVFCNSIIKVNQYFVELVKKAISEKQRK